MKKRFNKLMAIILSICILCSINLTVYADVQYNNEEVTVYITVSDISDYTMPVHIIMPRQELTVKNFNLADYGDTLIGLTAVEGVTYLHALVQLHRELYGDEDVKNKLMLNEYGYIKYFMGRSSANTMYKNGKDIFAYPNMINIKNGDEIQVCLYDEGHSQSVATFSESRLDDIAVNEKVSLQLSQHYAFPRNANPLSEAEICDENGLYVTDDNGDIIKTDKQGKFNVSFDEPGTYIVSAMPQVDYYMSEMGGQIITEWVPTEVTKTVEVTKKDLIGVEHTIHNTLDTTDVWVSMWLAFGGDYSNAPTYEAETGNAVGDYFIVSADNNPYKGIDTTKLCGNSAVSLNPGASITIPITTTVAGEWVIVWKGQSTNYSNQKFTVQVDDGEESVGTYNSVKVSPDGSIEMTEDVGIYVSKDFELGEHNVTITADIENTAPILVDQLVYGENVTTFSDTSGPFNRPAVDFCVGFVWDDTVYDSKLTPDDIGWIDRTVDLRPEGHNELYPYLTTQEDIVSEYTVTETITETVLEKVETIIPIDLFPKVNYTTPLVVINVSGDLMFLNISMTEGATTNTIKFDTKNRDLIKDKYTCYVASYSDDNRLVEVKTLSTLKDYSNSVTMSNKDFSYVKIFCWNKDMKPLCSAELYNPNDIVEETGLDWDYTLPIESYNTYVTTPTVARK